MPNYRTGQVWNYETREGEEASRLFIVKVEDHQDVGSIYHVYVDGLRLRNPYVEEGIQTELSHCPLSAEALDASDMRLIAQASDVLPNFSEGYRTWKEAFDNGEAGIFTIPVRKIVECLETAINS